MNRRGLFKRLGAAAVAVAVAPAVVVQAEPACAECEAVSKNPPPLPDAYKVGVSEDLRAAVLELAHAHAVRDGITHHAAFALLAATHFPTWYVEPTLTFGSTAGTDLTVTGNLCALGAITSVPAIAFPKFAPIPTVTVYGQHDA